MKDKPKDVLTTAEFQRVMREYMRVLLYAQLETAALETALIAAGVLSEDQLRQAREQVKSQAKAVVDSLGEATPERLLEMLRGFEGPVQ